MEKKLYIIRGVPGSGKSTKANEIFDEASEAMLSVDMWSADDYFMRPDGLYEFSFKSLKNAHAWCKNGVERSMKSVRTIDGDSIDVVILDNTNTQKWEYEPYLKLAEKYGYEVEEVVVGDFDKESIQKYAERNTHGVPIDKVFQMAERFER